MESNFYQEQTEILKSQLQTSQHQNNELVEKLDEKEVLQKEKEVLMKELSQKVDFL